jgi:endonuclease I
MEAERASHMEASSAIEATQEVVIDIETPLSVEEPKYTPACMLITIIGVILIIFSLRVLIHTDTGYYSNIDPERDDLIDQLNTLIGSNTQKIPYDKLWDAFFQTDTHWETERCKDIEGGISDIFNYKACFTRGTPHGTTLGTLTREHIWPKSWWECGNSCLEQEAFSDLHLVFPGEATGNNQRHALPYGVVLENTDTNDETLIGWMKGPCVQNSNRKCIEPPPEWKGVLARATLYVSVRYRNIFKYPCESSTGLCATNIAVQGAHLNEWFEDTLREWHHNYPITDAERKRNEAVYQLQGNRNPFVDHPEYVGMIQNF